MSYVWDELEESDGQRAAKEETLRFEFFRVLFTCITVSPVKSYFSLSGARMDFFPEIRDFVSKFLAQNKVLMYTREESRKHQLIIQVLKMIQYLVNYGYYTNHNDIRGVTFTKYFGERSLPKKKKNKKNHLSFNSYLLLSINSWMARLTDPPRRSLSQKLSHGKLRDASRATHLIDCLLRSKQRHSKLLSCFITISSPQC